MNKFAIVKRDSQFSGIVVSSFGSEQECSAAFDALVELPTTADPDSYICIDRAEPYPVGSRAPV